MEPDGIDLLWKTIFPLQPVFRFHVGLFQGVVLSFLPSKSGGFLLTAAEVGRAVRKSRSFSQKRPVDTGVRSLCFRQVGGRCKLMQPGDVVRCSEAEIAVAVRKMEAKMRKQQAKESRAFYIFCGSFWGELREKGRTEFGRVGIFERLLSFLFLFFWGLGVLFGIGELLDLFGKVDKLNVCWLDGAR